ncbi:archaeosine biosynthesis radical SAM protein RaSEA [Methanomicrobium antiquum]|uniref:Archaeosine biosynthesis radical SAM protein RaSEA n=1 Tax=Methanomicrobium antiquum TaxID=487686 RepID=A0AAF0JL49_9EURY|nr:archaeosine biosynthesis radical SAM protein RaSEA [Methanomicrobium antiquum]WFN35772.1 archaeosine biosynthesis radical SAM protein RaSEA [Methanomicrobium antiquum]
MISQKIEKPLACWKSKETYSGEVLDCLTVIFKSGGCSWNRCTMCGYKNERYHKMPAEELSTRIKQQVSWVLSEFKPDSYQMVKIFTSGSFFDTDEVPPGARDSIGEAFKGKIVIAESRTEYVKEDIISDFLAIVDDNSHKNPLYVAMGLETTNDYIREKCIDKGHTFEDFKNAVSQGRKAGAGIKTYLMMKPPFLTESEALLDMQKSLKECAPYSDMISMNLCTVQNRTDVERLWKQRAYRPPYLWSALKVLIEADVHVMCDPVGGGKRRGPHNCGKCDMEIVDAIREFSLNVDKELLRVYFERGCKCKNEWEFILKEEKPFCMPLTE